MKKADENRNRGDYIGWMTSVGYPDPDKSDNDNESLDPGGGWRGEVLCGSTPSYRSRYRRLLNELSVPRTPRKPAAAQGGGRG